MGGLIYGVLFKSGFYNSAPLKTMIDEVIGNQTFKRKVVVGTTNIDDGKFVTFSEKDSL